MGGNQGCISIHQLRVQPSLKSSAQPSSTDIPAAQVLEGEIMSFMKNAMFYYLLLEILISL